jgi:hypothetical protein
MAVSRNDDVSPLYASKVYYVNCSGGEVLQLEGAVKGVDPGITASVVQLNLLSATAHTETISQRFILT